ncbi:hypothetical protein [Lactobacillus huangpiensis]|nr:hypothetical protein [Lactobacillus huangpiensis]
MSIRQNGPTLVGIASGDVLKCLCGKVNTGKALYPKIDLILVSNTT